MAVLIKYTPLGAEAAFQLKVYLPEESSPSDITSTNLPITSNTFTDTLLSVFNSIEKLVDGLNGFGYALLITKLVGIWISVLI